MVNAHINTKQIFEMLGTIPDPEIPVITIKELGMLQNVVYKNNQYIISIMPTYTGCPAVPMIETQITEMMNELGINNIKIELIYSPVWTTDMMNDAAKEKLKQYGIAPPLHSSCSALKTVHKINCPRCKASNTTVISMFGSTACKALYKCNECKEPFEYFKCH